MITPTVNIATNATKGNIMKIIVFRFHFHVCATRQILLCGLLLQACERQRCIRLGVCLLMSRNLALSLVEPLNTQVSRFHPRRRTFVSLKNIREKLMIDLLDTCWGIRFEYPRAQTSRVVVVCGELQ